MLRGGPRTGASGQRWAPRARHRTTLPDRRAEAGRGRRQDVELGRHPAPHRRHQHHRRPTTRPTTSPTAADLKAPDRRPSPGACCWGEAEICISESSCHIDSDIQISSSTLAPPPSCYQLNVACDLSERRLLINDFAGALLRVGPARKMTLISPMAGSPTRECAPISDEGEIPLPSATRRRLVLQELDRIETLSCG